MIRVRFAPSPTGDLHIGSARTALFNYLFARSQQGKFILRIEDTDIARSTREFEESILADLRWLGLDWDEGPEAGGEYGPYRQSEKIEIYKKKALELIDSGEAYYCYCQPEELEEMRKAALNHGKMPKYDGRCRNLTEKEREAFLAKGRQPVIRFKVKTGKITFKDLVRDFVEFDSSVIGDFIILRSDNIASYHFAVVVDDHDMEISHVIRGEDHLTNTARHIQLFQALGSRLPMFAHIPMILGPDGNKLSKRHGSTAIYQYRKDGFLPQSMTNYLSMLSWSMPDGSDLFSLDEAASRFTIDRVSRSPAIFDRHKLLWMNEQYIHGLNLDELMEISRPHLEKLEFLEDQELSPANNRLKEMIKAVKTHIKVLPDLGENLQIFFQPPSDIISGWEEEMPAEIEAILKKDYISGLLDDLKDSLAQLDEIDEEKARAFLKELIIKYKGKGLKGKDLFMPVRIGLTGQIAGPEIYHLLSIYGLEESIKRINLVRDFLFNN